MDQFSIIMTFSVIEWSLGGELERQHGICLSEHINTSPLTRLQLITMVLLCISIKMEMLEEYNDFHVFKTLRSSQTFYMSITDTPTA